jgi:MFS family permease
MLFSIFGTAVGYLLFAVSHSILLLFAARVVDGITGGNISTAQAYLSDITPAEDRSKILGIFGAIFGLGFAMGPGVGALITMLPGVWGSNLGLGLITASLSFVNWAMALRRLPETLPASAREHNRLRNAGKRVQVFNITGFKHALALPGLNAIVWISLFATTAFATMQGTYSPFLITRYVRPVVQQYLLHDRTDALNEVARATAINPVAKPTATSGSEGAPVDTEIASDAPYPPSMGGDIEGGSTMTSLGFTLRRVEKELVRPRATRMAAWIFAAIGLTALLVQGGLIGPIKKRIGEINMVIIGTMLMAIGLALVPLPSTFIGQFPVMALLAFGNSIATPVLTALVSELSPEHERGEIIGVYQSVGSLGRIMGPNIGGHLFNSISPGAPYFSGGGIMLMSLYMAFKLRASRRKAGPLPSELARVEA